MFLPQTPESFTFDSDGNLTQDGRWDNTWDAENRLIAQQAISAVPMGAIADEHVAQILGYLRSARMEHGVLVNFGAAKFPIRKLAMSEALHRPAEN